MLEVFVEGRKKTKDKGEKKKRSGNSSEEDSGGAGRSRKKQKKGANAAGNTGNTASSGKTTGAGEGMVIHLSLFTLLTHCKLVIYKCKHIVYIVNVKKKFIYILIHNVAIFPGYPQSLDCFKHCLKFSIYPLDIFFTYL